MTYPPHPLHVASGMSNNKGAPAPSPLQLPILPGMTAESVMIFPPQPLRVAAGVSDNKGAPAPSPLQLSSPLPSQAPSAGATNSPGPSQPAPTLSTPSGATGAGDANTTATNKGSLNAGSNGSVGTGGSGESNKTAESTNTPSGGAAAPSAPSPTARSCAPSSLKYSCSLALDSRATVHWTLGLTTPVNICTAGGASATNASALQGGFLPAWSEQ